MRDLMAAQPRPLAHLLGVTLVSVALLVGAASPALALGVFVSHCGVLKAYVAPTTTAQGSITIGTATYPILMGGASPTLGESVCLTDGNMTPGALVGFTLSALPTSYCGDVRAFTAATATQTGSVTIGLAGHAPGRDPTLIVPAGTTIATPAIESRHCFATGLNGVGDATVVAELVLPSATASAAPVLSRPAGLPSTSSEPDTAPLVALAVAAAAGVLALIRARRRA